MQMPANSALINSLEQHVETQLQQAVYTFQNMDEEALLRPSPSGGWSIAQCLWHLNSYGHFYLPLIKRAIDNSESSTNAPVFKSGFIGNYFVKMMEPGTGKAKHKALKQHTPPATVPAYQTVAEFIQQLELLLAYLDKAQHIDLNAKRIPTSIFGLLKLKLGDVFRFIIAHNHRHIQQALKNI